MRTKSQGLDHNKTHSGFKIAAWPKRAIFTNENIYCTKMCALGNVLTFKSWGLKIWIYLYQMTQNWWNVFIYYSFKVQQLQIYNAIVKDSLWAGMVTDPSGTLARRRIGFQSERVLGSHGCMFLTHGQTIMTFKANLQNYVE